MTTPIRSVLAVLSLLAIAACDTTPDLAPPDEFADVDLGEATSELYLGGLAFDTPTRGWFRYGGTNFHTYRLQETAAGDVLALDARFGEGVNGYATLVKATPSGLARACFENPCVEAVAEAGVTYGVYVTARFRSYWASYIVTVTASPAQRTCGTRAGDFCDEGEFCNFPPSAQCGAADRPGFCEPVPEDCTQQFKPVESCDGTVYCNECYAAAWGASVIAAADPTSSDIVCSTPRPDVPPPFPPLPSCSTTNPCDEGQLCDYSELDLAECPLSYDGLEGVCRTPSATSCLAVYDPVCGCDGVTYANRCVLGLDTGVAVASEGECPLFPGEVTCSTDEPCAEGVTCDYSRLPLLECPASYDGLVGVCRDQRVTLCPQVFDPVCGCDGETYSNECDLSIRSGAIIANQGACEN